MGRALGRALGRASGWTVPKIDTCLIGRATRGPGMRRREAPGQGRAAGGDDLLGSARGGLGAWRLSPG